MSVGGGGDGGGGGGGDGGGGGRRRIVVAPDKFRGTLTAVEVCEAVQSACRESGSSWDVVARPMADGGEGFGEVLAASAPPGTLERRTAVVAGPLGERVEALWWLMDLHVDTAGQPASRRDEIRRTAVIESAAACGLALAGGPDQNDPLLASTFGVGELVGEVLEVAPDEGIVQIVIGCGGSASTDGGAGALDALGAWSPSGGSSRTGELARLPVIVAYDTATPFAEAAERFGPQKGATPAMVTQLTARLAELERSYRQRCGIDLGALPGSGAAGGLAGGLAALGGTLRSGASLVAEVVGLRDDLASCDAVVTGEGRLDDESWVGKVVGEVCRLRRDVAPASECLIVVGTASGGQAARIERVGAQLAVLVEKVGEARSFNSTAAALGEVVVAWLERLP